MKNFTYSFLLIITFNKMLIGAAQKRPREEETSRSVGAPTKRPRDEKTSKQVSFAVDKNGCPVTEVFERLADASKQNDNVLAFKPVNISKVEARSRARAEALKQTYALTQANAPKQKEPINIRDLIKAGNIKEIEKLLNSSTSIQGVDEKGNSVFSFAVAYNQPEILKLFLLSKKLTVKSDQYHSVPVSPNQRNSFGNFPLRIAYERNALKCFEVLLRSNKVDPNDKLRSVLESGSLGLVMYVLGCTPKPNINTEINEQGDTPLIFAARSNRPEVVKALLDMPEIDLNKPNIKGDTALTLAAKQRHFGVMSQLMIKGAHPLLKNAKGETALSYFEPQTYWGKELRIYAQEF